MATRAGFRRHFSRGKAVIGLALLVSLQMYLVSLSPIGPFRSDHAPGATRGPGNPDAGQTAGSQPPAGPDHTHGVARSLGPATLNFDGSNNYIEVADNPDLRLSAPMTIEAWIKPTTEFSGERHIAGKRTYELGIAPLGDGFQALFKFTSGGKIHSVASGEFSLNRWYHIAGDYDGSNLRLFVNGAKVAAIVTSGAIEQATTPFRIGSADDGAGDLFPGMIDEVRVSDNIRYRGSGPAQVLSSRKPRSRRMRTPAGYGISPKARARSSPMPPVTAIRGR